VGSGSSVRVDIHNFVGGDSSYCLSDQLIHILHSKGYYTLDHIRSYSPERGHYWLGSTFFGLQEPMRSEWEAYLQALNKMGVILSTQEDTILWNLNKVDGMVIAKLAFDHLCVHTYGTTSRWRASGIWSWHIPLNLKCFIWLVFHNRTLSGII